MKRGFLNSKKAKDKPLYDSASTLAGPRASSESAVIAPPKQLPPSGDRTTTVASMISFISYSEPVDL